MLNESLHKENLAKDREIRKLHKDAQQYEQTIMHLRSEISLAKYHTPDVSKKDAEVMAGMCCTGAECGDWEPVKDFNSILREEMINYQERIQKMENNLKASGEDVRALRKVNVGLREEIHSLRAVCAALGEQARAAALRGHFKDDIIREMRRQLKHAKSKESTCDLTTCKYIRTSTPNVSHELAVDCGQQSPDVSKICVDRGQDPDCCIMDETTQAPIVISHESDDILADTTIQSSAGCSKDSTQTPTSTKQPRSERASSITICGSKWKSIHDLTQDQLNRTYELRCRNSKDSTRCQLRKKSMSQCGNDQDSIEKNSDPRIKPCKLLYKRHQNLDQCLHTKTFSELTDLAQEFAEDQTGLTSESMKKDNESVQDRNTAENKQNQDCRCACECKIEESRSSANESPGSSCASARAHYYQNKLLATLRILQNKEETVRVQAESLVVAEARIAALTTRSAELKREIERKGKEIQTLRNTLEECKSEKANVSTTTEFQQEMDNEENIVTITLQNNLGVIEKLYRECFYETVKQESLIELLRKSYLDVRLMEKEKSNQITKLHNVINTQKWSLDRCQDIAIEVENLKMEISNFINSSSNDSGMWEESVVGELNEDLQDIAAQLLKLRDLITCDCTCGLEEENMKLKQLLSDRGRENEDLRTKISDLESNLSNKDNLDKQYHEEIQNKERELNSIRARLHLLEEKTKDKSSSCDQLTHKLSQVQVLLDSKTSELFNVQKQCEAYKDTIRMMQQELDKTEQITKENLSLRNELCCASRRVTRLQRRDEEQRDELARSRALLRHVDDCYREKAASATELERRLDEAHARGAELCAEAGRAVRAVRAWARAARDTQREQEEKLKQKECQLRELQERLESIQSAKVCLNRVERCCSTGPAACALTIGERDRYTTATRMRETERPCPCDRRSRSFDAADVCGRQRRESRASTSEREIASCVPPRNASSLDASGRENVAGTSASEMASCSSAPVPPKRTLKKKQSVSFCGIRRQYGWLGPFCTQQRDALTQRPVRCDAASPADPPPPRPRQPTPLCDLTLLRPLSPGEEMYSRIESLSAALADSYRRWSRRAT